MTSSVDDVECWQDNEIVISIHGVRPWGPEHHEVHSKLDFTSMFAISQIFVLIYK